MAQTTMTSRELVDEWLQALNTEPGTEDFLLNEEGISAITRGDGQQLVLRLAEDTLSLFIQLIEVPADADVNFFKIALNFNLYPSQVGGGHIAYDALANMLAYCAHLPMDVLNQGMFDAIVENFFDVADELRSKFISPAE
jgi:hypothetical protein